MKKVFLQLIICFVLIFSSLMYGNSNKSNENLWEIIRKSSTWDSKYLSSKVKNSHVIQSELKKISRSPGYFQSMNKRAEPFLHHIVTEIQNRDLPLEIALLPILESGYNYKAHSHRGAHGIWQLMPATAKYLGLKSNNWNDDRRNIIESTNAALDYLTKINKEFDKNWMLTLGAYNAGSGTIRSAIRHNKKRKLSTQYWDLQLPVETKKYAPKLLAILIALKNPEKYNQKLPFTANKQYFTKVDFPKQTNILSVAKKHKIDPEIMKVLNSHYPRLVTAPKDQKSKDSPYILVPAKYDKTINKSTKKANYHEKIAYNESTDKTWVEYTVKSGESLSLIAKNHKVSLKDIKQMNNITNANKIKAGKKISIPVAVG